MRFLQRYRLISKTKKPLHYSEAALNIYYMVLFKYHHVLGIGFNGKVMLIVLSP